MPSWKLVVGSGLLVSAGLGTMIGIAYAQTPVPDEGNADATKTAAIFYYSDGKTEIGRIGKNRVTVPISKVPMHVRYAVVAAENRSFYSDSGFSVSGISRAVWTNVSGGDTQGGSTITQQLAKNYYLNDKRTMGRKFRELFISLKLEDKLGSKDKILELYLNTIYFGRNSYGIEAASNTYFGKHVNQLTPDEGALLAAIIQQPGKYDPRSGNKTWQAETAARYRYVLDGMHKMNRLTDQQFAEYNKRLPETKPIGGPSTFGGQRGYAIKRALKELDRQGIDEKTVVEKGLRVTTTFDKDKMAAAKKAVEDTVPGVDPNKLLKKHIRLGLASVDTDNGEVQAIYGGPSYLKDAYDNVWLGSAQAGSAMKPYVLAAALEKGYGLKSLVEGRSGMGFDGQGNSVKGGAPNDVTQGGLPNSHHAKGGITLIQAMKESTNTAFAQLALKTGPAQIVAMAEQLGVSSDMVGDYKDKYGIALGVNNIRPIEQAAGYAVFANGGTYYQPHVIRRVGTADGKVFKKLDWEVKRSALSKPITQDVTYALQQPVKPGGTAPSAALSDRPVAGKTGTTDKNVATWFVGYVPQISTAVTMYNNDRKTLVVPGIGEVVGGSVPARIWHAYMAEATKGMAVEQFPPPAWVGTPQKWVDVFKEKKKDKGKDKRPPWCDNNPFAQYDPRCRGGGDNGGGGGKQPCQSPFPDANCDPNKPPSNPPPKWWCTIHNGDPRCDGRKKGRGHGGPAWPNSVADRPRILATAPPDEP
ncbi:transglycosylase domain-containing protein [Actinomadura logoneensis]|nr:transglycosylase domain-containing protein [Actinomadura logoneensis]